MDGQEPVWASDAILRSLRGIYGQDANFFEMGGLRLSMADTLERFGADPAEIPGDFSDGIERTAVEPLDAVRVYLSSAGSEHWHFITMGFSDLYSELTNEPGMSGYGFELTMRVVRLPSDEAPPFWPVQVLQNLAGYVFTTGNVFEPNQHMSLNGPIVHRQGCTVTSVAFAFDSELGQLQCDSGKIDMLQLVGLTSSEYEEMQRWQVSKFLDLLRQETNQILIMDPARSPILDSPGVREKIDAGVKSDGSSVGAHYTDVLSVQSQGAVKILTMTATSAQAVRGAMEGRLAFGRHYRLMGTDGFSVVLLPGEVCAVADMGREFEVVLSPSAWGELFSTLEPRKGIYKLKELPDLVIQVVPTEVKDRDGKVVSVIG